jgi:5-methylcytosine-specific restriction endonuclease McrA
MDKLKVLERDKSCVYCQKQLCPRTIRLDEYLPGEKNMYNLVAACASCKRRKAGKLPLNFVQEIICESK